MRVVAKIMIGKVHAITPYLKNRMAPFSAEITSKFSRMRFLTQNTFDAAIMINTNRIFKMVQKS